MREAVIAQLVDKSAGADLRATKMLIDMLKDIEKRVGPPPRPEPQPVTPADEEVIENLIARLHRWNCPKRNEKARRTRSMSPSPPLGGEGGARARQRTGG
jgi:hypothetical protein